MGKPTNTLPKKIETPPDLRVEDIQPGAVFAHSMDDDYYYLVLDTRDPRNVRLEVTSTGNEIRASVEDIVSSLRRSEFMNNSGYHQLIQEEE